MRKIIAILGTSFILSLIILEILLRVSGWVISYYHDRNRKTPDGYTVLLIGESTTSSVFTSWGKQLAERLLAAYPTVPFTVINEGLGGTNTAYITARLPELLRKYRPQMVITMMGINDGTLFFRYEKNWQSEVRLLLTDFRIYKLVKYLAERFTPSSHMGTEQVRSWISEPVVRDISPEEVVIEDQFRANGDMNGAITHYLNVCAQQCETAVRIRLGWLYLEKNQFEPAEEQFAVAYREASASPRVVNGLLQLSLRKNDMQRAGKLVSEHLSLATVSAEFSVTLAEYYERDNQLAEARTLLESSLTVPDAPDTVLQQLVRVYAKLGLSDTEIKRRLGTVNARQEPLLVPVSGREVPALTAYHYTEISKMIRDTGAVHVAMQYPRMDVKTIREYFPNQDEILFVENEKNFEAALQQGAFEEYFYDHFAGIFGHTTRQGDQLIVENILATLDQATRSGRLVWQY